MLDSELNIYTQSAFGNRITNEVDVEITSRIFKIIAKHLHLAKVKKGPRKGKRYARLFVNSGYTIGHRGKHRCNLKPFSADFHGETI